MITQAPYKGAAFDLSAIAAYPWRDLNPHMLDGMASGFKPDDSANSSTGAGAGDGSRTHTYGLEARRTAVVLHPRSERRESNPRVKVGNLAYCHCTTPALAGEKGIEPLTVVLETTA